VAGWPATGVTEVQGGDRCSPEPVEGSKEGNEGSGNSARTQPWRRPSSETKNEASLGEATTRRKRFRPTSRTEIRSNKEPSQN
jgi:hypothetical protein